MNFNNRTYNKTIQNICYSLPRVAGISLYAPMNIVQGIYAKHYGLALTTIAVVILFSRIFDAITDPIIGYLSDRYRLKHGTRKPYMIAGGTTVVVSGFFLYSPPANVSILYFSFWLIVFYFGLTLFEIPHMAWGGEISRDTHEKNRTYNLRTIAGFSGLVLFYCSPLLPIWETTEITPEKLKFSAIVSGLLMLPLLYISMKYVPDGTCCGTQGATIKTGSSRTELGNIIKSIVLNKPLLLFLGAFLCTGIGLGMWLGLLFIYIDVYLGMGVVFSQVYLTSLVIGVMASFMWAKIARRVGKKNTWLLAMVVGIAAFAYTAFLSAENASFWSLLLLLTLMTLCSVCIESLPQSMLSDIVDYSTLKFGVYRGSTYFSLFMFMYKGAFAIGGACGLAVAGWWGFDPSAGHNTDYGAFGLMLAMTWIPTVLALIAAVFIFLSPITVQRHHIIRQRLDRLEARGR